MKAAPSAVIAAIINTIGFASMVTFNAANAVFTAVIAPEILGTIVIITFLVPSSIELSQSTNFCNQLTIFFTSGIRSCPKEIDSPSRADFKMVRAVCNLVVSPPISTVIPIILLATVDTSFRKNGHKKSPDLSRHEKSTNHF